MEEVQVQPLPCEIILEIFQRLPPDALIQFKTLSKSWCNTINNLINDPSFIELQLSRSKSQPRLLLWDNETYTINELLLLEEYKKGTRDMLKARKIRLEYDNFHEEQKIHVVIVGSCNGLICKIWRASRDRYHGMYSRICVCNPLTKESAELPLRSGHPNFIKSGIFGFGVDSTGKYKVIHIYKDMYMWRSKIIALGGSSWRELDFPYQLDHRMFEKIKGMLFIDGALYCIVQERINQKKIILMFDIHDENFHIIKFHPSIEPEKTLHDCGLTKIKDSLVLFQHESVFFRLWMIEIKHSLAKGNLMFQFSCPVRDKPWLIGCSDEKNVAFECSREISMVGALSNNMFLFNVDNIIRTIPGYQACSVGSSHLVYSVDKKTLSPVRISGTIPKLFQAQTFVPSLISPIVVCGKAKKDYNIRGPVRTKP